MATFGELLRRFRRSAGLSQEALAEQAGLGKDTISALERGARRAPYRDTVDFLAVALRLEPNSRHALEAAAAHGRERGPSSEETVHAHELPSANTPLIGRDDAIAEILTLLDRSRLVTITGAGGIGKTRVAIAVADRFADARDLPAWLVDFGALRSGADVASKVAASLGLRITESEHPIESFVASIRRHRGIIVLDNCEHVVVEAAEIAAAIERVCSNLFVLATSRERLAIEGEQVYRLQPLCAEAALQLFEQRAASVAGSFALTQDSEEIAGAICGQVDNIPLAIELAAARVPFLGLNELRARLRGQLAVLSGGRRDAPPRQQTMSDTIAWSYALLDVQERALFRRVSVFAGGWGLESLEPVTLGAPLDENNVLRAFASLVEKSLISVELDAVPARYRLLQPVLAFAREKLAAADEREEFSNRHALWVAQEAEAAGDDVARFAKEIDNARVALEWALDERGDPVVAARIVGSPGGSWARMGLLAECRRYCESVLAKLDVNADPKLAARVFRALILATGGRKEIEAIARAIPCAELAGDWNGVAVLTSRLALRFGEHGRFDEAERAFERVWEIRDRLRLGLSAEWATVLMHRASVYRREGLLDEAELAIAESHALTRSLHKPLHEMWTLLAAGEIAFARGEPSRAIERAHEALELCRSNRHAVGEILTRTNLAGYYLALGQTEDARTHARIAIEQGYDAEPGVVFAAILHAGALDAVDGNIGRAAKLKGYIDEARSREELVLDPTEASSYGILVTALEQALTLSEMEVHAIDGSQLNHPDAFELASGI
ncbi:MAG: helix-turn-helix domain-containing protein [Candidatus Eremiobacteraeota bacterium]|nr:helix-turn-helix domain-containing protein [Candidatus Eremiobacteraeota bacterium]